MLNRRDFVTAAIATAGLGAAGTVRAADMPKSKDFPVPEDEIFKGMGGAYAAMYTPFYRTGSKAGELNEEMIERIVEYHIAKGLTGEYLTGSTGEGFTLSLDERERVFQRVVKASRGRMKVIAHVGCLSTRDACDLAKRAAKAGVDWVSSVAPVYFGQSFDAAYDHYRQISEATDLPFMVYSVHGKLVPDQAVRFFDLKNVHGMKYTGRDYYDLGAMCRKLSKPAIFFSGADEQTLNGFATGRFSGCIGTTDNNIPEQFVKLCERVLANDFAGAARYQENVSRFIDALFSVYGFAKAAMRYIGLDCGDARSPVGKPLTEAQYADVVKAAKTFEFLRENDANLI